MRAPPTRLIIVFVQLHLPILAADRLAAGANAAPDLLTPTALTPVSPGWIIGFLLLILWLTVAAIILGPLIRHFQLEPRSTQFFADDRPTGGRRP